MKNKILNVTEQKSNVLEDFTSLKSEIDTLLIPVNELLKKAKELGLHFNIHEGYSPKRESPTVSIDMYYTIR